MTNFTKSILIASLLIVWIGSPTEAAPLPGSDDGLPTADRPVGFRGDGTARYPGAAGPISWSRVKRDGGYEAKGIVWATPLPNKGVSSPIVVGDRIFVTSEFSDLVCIDRASGKILWIRSNLEFDALTAVEKGDMPIAEKLEPQGRELSSLNDQVVAALNALLPTALTSEYRQLPILEKKRAVEKQLRDEQQKISKKRFTGDWPQVIYGFCTETPASDGKHVCAFFATGISGCYDLDGNRRWIAKGSNGGEEKGHYASPLIAGNKFVVWGDPEVRAYDLEDGKLAWRTAAKGSNCGSVYRIQAGDDLIACVQTNCFVRIKDGQVVWNSGNLNYSFTTPIVEGNSIYYWSAGYNKEFKAYEIPVSSAAGKVTPRLTFEKPQWGEDELPGKFDKGDVNATPLFVDGLIYQLYVGGGLAVQDAATGKMVYRKVLPLKPRVEYWAWGGASVSPTLGGKYIYLMDNQGRTVVIEPGRTYREIAVNRIEETLNGKEQPQNLATPVFAGKRMYYRTPGYLYCIGE